jgi:hypothetical protein
LSFADTTRKSSIQAGSPQIVRENKLVGLSQKARYLIVRAGSLVSGYWDQQAEKSLSEPIYKLNSRFPMVSLTSVCIP